MCVKGLIHITGGGFIDNMPRVLPEGVGVRIRKNSWQIPPIFSLIQQKSDMHQDEMYHVFNMGIGMVVVVGRDDVDEALEIVGRETSVIGDVVSWTEGRRVVIT